MLKRIVIENFRGFSKLDAKISDTTVLLGPNSSGKTTILYAIRLVCELITIALASDTTARLVGNVIHVARDTLLESPKKLLPLLDWKALFLDQKVGEGAKFSIDLFFEDSYRIQSIKLVVSNARNNQLKFTIEIESAEAAQTVTGISKKSPRMSQTLTDWLQTHAPMAVFIPPFYGVVRDEERRVPVVVDKLVGSGDQSHVVRNLIADLLPSQHDQLNAFLRELTGTTLSYRTSGDKLMTETPLRVEFKDSNGPIELSAAGAGLINLLALYASLARWQSQAGKRHMFFLLDEPEAHLHPRLQGDVAQRISALIVKEFGAQLLMATHSVEIINRLGQQPEVTLLRTDRSSTTNAATVLESQQEIIDDLQSWVDMTPFSAINFLASRKVVFHEGVNDAKALKRCAELYFRQRPNLKMNFEKWNFVSLEGTGQEKIPSLLKRLLNSPIWANQQSNISLVMVLDKDYQRNPGFQTDQSSENEVHRYVWPLHSIESVFLEPTILAYWIKSFAGNSTPENIEQVIQDALVMADTDDQLNDASIDQLTLALKKNPITIDGKELTFGSDQHFVAAMREARNTVLASPAMWQRGKDRSRFVLGRIHQSITLPAYSKFSTDIFKLLMNTDINHISNPSDALPRSVIELLEWMVDPAR